MPARYGRSDEPGDVGRHSARVRWRDNRGNQFEVPGDRVTKGRAFLRDTARADG